MQERSARQLTILAHIRDADRPVRPGKIIVPLILSGWRHHTKRLNVYKDVQNGLSVIDVAETDLVPWQGGLLKRLLGL